jgi:hypothetical protein
MSECSRNRLRGSNLLAKFVVDVATGEHNDATIKPFMTRWSGALQAIVIIAYGVLCILRAPKIFAGRFRAEEGLYYGVFQHGTVFKNPFLTGPGYPEVFHVRKIG